MIIKTREDLLGTYVLREDREVFKLFMDKCEEFGLTWYATGGNHAKANSKRS